MCKEAQTELDGARQTTKTQVAETSFSFALFLRASSFIPEFVSLAGFPYIVAWFECLSV